MWDQVCWSGGNQAENSFIVSRQYGERENKYRLIRPAGGRQKTEGVLVLVVVGKGGDTDV